MKVYDLRCAHEHGFEGWFGSAEAFDDQVGRGLVECPWCGSTEVVRLPSAARLNLGASAPAPVSLPSPAPSGPAPVAGAVGGAGAGAPLANALAKLTPELRAELAHAWQKAVQHVVANTEDVGDRFATEARRIHRGESEQRGIRGQTTPEEREALADEGIEVHQIPMPVGAPPGSTH